MSDKLHWIPELTVSAAGIVEDALITLDKIYYLHRSAPGQKTRLYEHDRVTQKTRLIANGYTVASIAATETQVVVLLDGFETTPPLQGQIGEIFQLQDDGSISLDVRNDPSHYLKAGIGIRTNNEYVVSCKWMTIGSGNSRLLVWRRDQSYALPELEDNLLSLDLKQDEVPSYRWAVSPSVILALSADEKTILGTRFPHSSSEIMTWSIKLRPAPVTLDAVFCTGDGRIFARSQTYQLLEYRRDAWEWMLGAASVLHDRGSCAVGSTHFVRSDSESCFALRHDGKWEKLGPKLASPRISTDDEGVTTLTGIRNGKEIISLDLDYLPGRPSNSTRRSSTVPMRMLTDSARQPNWLLTFKTNNSFWGAAAFTGWVEGDLIDTRDTSGSEFTLTNNYFANGGRYYEAFNLDVDYTKLVSLRLKTTAHSSLGDQWTVDWAEAWHLPTGLMWHFRINEDIPDEYALHGGYYKAIPRDWKDLKHVSGQSRAQILFWDWTFGQFGHVALRLADGTYISWWPVSKVSKKNPEADGGKSTYDIDASSRGEDRVPDIEIELRGLNISNISHWWRTFDIKAKKYNLFSWSCSTIIWEAFIAGGVLKEDPNILSKVNLSYAHSRRGIFWPSDILAIAEELYKIGYYK